MIPAWGLKQPTAVVTMQVKSGDQAKPVTLTIGAQDPADKSYPVKSSESEYYVRVPETAVQQLVAQDRAAFLLAPPTPAAPAVAATPAP